MEQKILKKFEATGHCPVRDVVSRLGDKWSILVLTTLKVNGRLRFSGIQRTIGDISQRMLTVTLRSMEADGIVSREVYAEVPPKVEYELTPLGHELFVHISALVGWAEKNINTILACRNSAG
jgi:DNA-binding HxlR family transcriptional regulator